MLFKKGRCDISINTVVVVALHYYAWTILWISWRTKPRGLILLLLNLTDASVRILVLCFLIFGEQSEID